VAPVGTPSASARDPLGPAAARGAGAVLLALLLAPLSGSAAADLRSAGPTLLADTAVADTVAADTVETGAPPRPAFRLDTLHVTAASRSPGGRAASTRSVEVLTRAEIERTPARSVADLLRRAAGVEVRDRSAAQADLSIRGSSFEQVVVLVDGVRMNDAQTGHFHLNVTVPLEEIERIEIVRGPASALYGADAVGGVVNIVTDRGETRRAGGSAARDEARGKATRAERLRLEGGSFGQGGAAATGRTRLGALRATGGAELRRSEGHRDGTDSRILKSRVGADLPLGGGRLDASAGFALRDFGADNFYSPFPSYEETRTLTASLGWTPRTAEGFRVEPRLSLRRHTDDFVLRRDDPAFHRNRHTTWKTGGQLVARGSPGAGVAIAGGGEAFVDRIDSDNLGRRSEARAALFAELVAGTRGDAVATVGLRGDWHEAYGTELLPSASFAAWPLGRLKLRGSVGRSFRTPSFTERFLDSPSNVGTPGLDPETAWEGEVGTEVALPHGWELGATGFLREADDLVDWSRPAGTGAETPWRTRNVESATFRGLELEASAPRLLGTRLRLGLELLSVDTEASGGFVSKRALRPLTEALRLELDRRAGPLELALQARRVRRRGESGGYAVVDLRTALAPGAAPLGQAGPAPFLEVTNLTDADFLDIAGNPAPGAAVVAGLEWRTLR